MKQTDWIETFTGKQFYPLEPDLRDVDIIDIAHSLSNMCRYTGHSNKYYSVAEHCILMCDFAGLAGHDILTQLIILLHDAHETYIGDISRPIKQSILQKSEFLYEQFKKYITQLDEVIFEALNIPQWAVEKNKDYVKFLDNTILAREKQILFPNSKNEWSLSAPPLDVNIWCHPPEIIEKHFLNRYKYLSKQLS